MSDPKPATRRTILQIRYGPKRALPKHPADKSPATWVRYIECKNAADYEATNALEALGYHVTHPATHPNGRGRTQAAIHVPARVDTWLPQQIEVQAVQLPSGAWLLQPNTAQLPGKPPIG